MLKSKEHLSTTIAALVLILLVSSAYARGMQQVAAVEDLWMDMRIGPPLIDLFNEAARTNDIARVDHPSQVGQLRGIEAGRKMVVFKSVEEAQELLPGITGNIDIIGYNLENNPGTPDEDKADPIASIQAMRDLADTYDLDLAFGPDHDFALSHGVEAAPYADIFVLQVQRQQTNPDVVSAFVGQIVPRLRAANPDLQVSVQVRTEGDMQGIVDLLDTLKNDLDGVSILTSPDTVDVAEELVIALRPYVTPSGAGSEIYIPLALLLIGLPAGVLYLRRRKTANDQQPPVDN